MSQRDKLVQRMRATPGNVRFQSVDALLRHEGFILFNQRGSHCTYHHSDGRVITIVRPHGLSRTCHPADIGKLLALLKL